MGGDETEGDSLKRIDDEHSTPEDIVLKLEHLLNTSGFVKAS